MAVGAGNVVGWGMSQGATASLVATLLWEGEKTAACVGVCGWFPLRGLLEDAVRVGQHGDIEATRREECFKRLITRLRDLLQLPPASHNRIILEIPAFIGHGEDDSTVSASLAREAASSLERISADVECRMYPDLDHWCSEDMLSDIIDFVKTRLCLKVDTSMQDS